MIAATDPAPVESPGRPTAEQSLTVAAAPGEETGALGHLTEFVTWAASVRGVHPPSRFEAVRCVVFAADDPDEPESAAPAARRLLRGEGPFALLAERSGAGLRLVDVGLAGDELPGASRRAPAVSEPLEPTTLADVLAAVGFGRTVADEEVDSGADLLVPGVLSAGSTVAAATVVAALTDTEPVWALGFDAHTPDAVWMRRCAAVRDRLREARPQLGAPYGLLAAAGGVDLAALVGFLLQAAVRRTPALLDGPAVAAAALVVGELAAEASPWCCAPQTAGTAAERLAYERLGLEPVLSLGVRLGDGTGALTALPLLTAAVALAAATSPEARDAPERPVPTA
ncbi:MAG TPA: nicotinate-nucleotide--dimethylbenzimidazole phosphoribosyltransferase [Cryptosporangiaceae bacterium]|nr:nicotinate-nucleotide--dimethylbenzimidazole phosphoribosyltransferase [Cryptosporangiaceae bacterium]